MILLDTDILIDILRSYPRALEWSNSRQSDTPVTSGYVAMELIQGCRNQDDLRRVMDLLRTCQVHWLDAQGCNQALTLFAIYHLSHNLGMIDALIAQTALVLDMPLATFNQKHYAAVPKLRMLQPYQRM